MHLLTFRRTIPREDLLLRVMGPDQFKALYYVDTVKYGTKDGEPVTYAAVAPLPPGETRLLVDSFGQMLVNPHAVEVDSDGVARLLPFEHDEH